MKKNNLITLLFILTIFSGIIGYFVSQTAGEGQDAAGRGIAQALTFLFFIFVPPLIFGCISLATYKTHKNELSKKHLVLSCLTLSPPILIITGIIVTLIYELGYETFN